MFVLSHIPYHVNWRKKNCELAYLGNCVHTTRRLSGLTLFVAQNVSCKKLSWIGYLSLSFIMRESTLYPKHVYINGATTAAYNDYILWMILRVSN